LQSEYHYEYTACDSSGSRWRVAVPHTPGLCTGLPDPVRGTECSFSCKAGEFLDMKAQTCQPCAAGTYSLGTGVRFDEWDEVPRGFTNVAANLELDDGFGDSVENCTADRGVGPRVAERGHGCAPLAAHLALQVQNDQCQPAAEESRWMRTSDQGWTLHSVELSRGNNVLYWRTTAFSVWARVPKPVLLRNVAITGVAYTSECFPCKPGSFAAAAGSSSCRLCPADAFSGKGATACQPCERDAYAEPGSASCKQRPPCTTKDYFSTHTACDGSEETQLMFKWAEPKICSEELPGAAKLPPSGVKSKCPPCNPGFFKSNGSACQPCPYGTYSSGSGCTSCPPGTEPALGLEYKWWNVLPSNMETTVLSGINFEYKGMAGWEVAGDYVYTVAGASDNDFMILTLLVDGFGAPAPSEELARITFVFETICSAGCELYFMVGVNARTNTPVETWTGAQGRQSYSYVVERNASTSFTWAFQRTPAREAVSTRRCHPFLAPHHGGDTNLPAWVTPSNPSRETPTLPRCPQSGEGGASCGSCPAGVTRRGRPQARSLCYSDCSPALAPRGRPLRYDLSALAAPRAFASGPSFTSKGLKYFHLFNISLCGQHGRVAASCADNVTETRAGGPSSHTVTAHVCQAIVVPSDVLGHKGAVSSQPVSLADRLVGVTAGPTLDGIVAPPEHFPATATAELPDVVFFYRWVQLSRWGHHAVDPPPFRHLLVSPSCRANEVTQSCSSGRATAIRLRCNPLHPGAGTLAVPSKCPDGTCDGCTFHFLWETAEACPLCSAADYRAIVGACLGGVQRTTYVWREPRLCRGGSALPRQQLSVCKSMDFWLKVGIAAGTGAAVLLAALTCYFWKKNRRRYKYSKLVMNSTAKDSELPAPDSCAIMEGEDAEDDLIFTSKKSLFGKIKSFTSKRTSDGFDSVPLKTSSGSTDMEL
ncbi:K1324 protein, partial [Nothocercus julius]|nr:K1324 protein [Nothocercus julius]